MSSYPTLDALAAKGDGTLWRRGDVWTYADAPLDASGSNLKLPTESAPDAIVQTAIASGEWGVYVTSQSLDNTRVLTGAAAVAIKATAAGTITPLPVSAVGSRRITRTSSGGGSVLAISGTSGSANVGDTTSFTPTISGGTAPYTVAATGLPPGRSIANTATGLTTGAYTTAGTYSATYTVTDALGATASMTRSITVAAAAAAVTVSGTPQVGQTLTASESSNWSVGGVARNFLAASTTYVPVPGDVGKTVTATGVSSGATSAATAAVTNAALPAVSPTLAYGARFAIAADSIGQQNSQGLSISGDTANGSITTKSIGELTQLLTMESRINVDDWYDLNKNASRLTNGANQGIAGQSSTQIATRFSADVLSLTLDGVIIAAGTNNTQQRATVLSDIQSMVSNARTAGKAAIVATIRPNAVANESVNRAKADIVAINASIRSYVTGLADPLVVLWDAYKQYDRGDGYLDPADAYDSQLHPNQRGAELGAWGNDPASPSPDSLAFAVRRLVQPGSRTADLLAANTNFLNNPNFATTTGGTLDTGVTSGTAPSGWRFGRKTSSHLSTAAISYEANAATGGNSMVLTFTAQGSNSGEEFDLYAFQINKTGLGSVWVRTFAEVETDGKTWIGSVSPSFLTYESGTATNYTSANLLDTVAPYASRPGVARRRLIMSDAVLTRSGATAYAPKIALFVLPALATPSDTSVVKILRVGAIITPSPKTAWGQ